MKKSLKFKEFKIIDSIIKKIPADKEVLIPVGDDAAFLSQKFGNLVITQDVMAEGTHFSLEYSTGENIATKLFNSNASDLAAMGAIARFAMLSAGINNKFDSHLSSFIKTITDLCLKNGITILGGDTVKSQHCFFSLVLMGLPINSKNVLKRKLALPDDIICLSGPTGVSALGLDLIKKGEKNSAAVQLHLGGINRCDLANILPNSTVECATDISDGLFFNACDLPKPGCGINLDSSKVPISHLFGNYPKDYIFDKIFFGGEDYELLFTVAPKNIAELRSNFKNHGKDFFAIGKIIAEEKFLIDSKIPKNSTFDHFG